MSRHHVLPRVLSIALVGALVLTACASGSKYEYVKSKQEQVFFKIPKQWDYEQIPPNGIRGVEDPPPNWRVAFAAPGGVAEVSTLLQPVPNGEASVLNLTRAQSADINPSDLRMFILSQIGVDEDPLELARAQDPRIDLLGYEELNTKSDFRGLSITFTWKAGEPDSWFTITQIGMLNDTNTKLYFFRINCATVCFLNNQAAINTVANSWTVAARGAN